MKVGILGAGQLAKMLIEAGQSLGLEFLIYSETPGVVEHLAPVTQARFDDVRALQNFIESCDVVTYEWENLPIEELDQAVQSSPKFFPKVDTLKTVADRFVQKNFFRSLGIETANFCLIDEPQKMTSQIKQIGFPGILKTTRYGYDGRGQKRISNEKDCEVAWDELGNVPLIYEKFVPFERELSLIACRAKGGEVRFYPLVESIHRDGILRKTIAPADEMTEFLTLTAQNYAEKVFKSFDYVGILALELFQCGQKLLLNEMASRVHNTGHWTIEGAQTSQFENHLRAGLGWTLGETKPTGFSAMLNLIGEIPEAIMADRHHSYFLHVYGKNPKPLRKLGHLTLLESSASALIDKLDQVEKLLLGNSPKESI